MAGNRMETTALQGRALSTLHWLSVDGIVAAQNIDLLCRSTALRCLHLSGGWCIRSPEFG